MVGLRSDPKSDLEINPETFFNHSMISLLSPRFLKYAIIAYLDDQSWKLWRVTQLWLSALINRVTQCLQHFAYNFRQLAASHLHFLTSSPKSIFENEISIKAATLDGVLGGFPETSEPDLRESRCPWLSWLLVVGYKSAVDHPEQSFSSFYPLSCFEVAKVFFCSTKHFCFSIHWVLRGTIHSGNLTVSPAISSSSAVTHTLLVIVGHLYSFLGSFLQVSCKVTPFFKALQVHSTQNGFHLYTKDTCSRYKCMPCVLVLLITAYWACTHTHIYLQYSIYLYKYIYIDIEYTQTTIDAQACGTWSCQLLFRRFLDLIARGPKPPERSTVLDCGAGIGRVWVPRLALS